METKLIYSIYRITNMLNGKVYIGYTKNVTGRKAYYKHAGSHDTRILRSIRKHGWSNFTFDVIYQSCDMEHTQNVMEDFFIEEHMSRNPQKGYNVRPGGNVKNGYRHSQETRLKISLSMKRTFAERKRKKQGKQSAIAIANRIAAKKANMAERVANGLPRTNRRPDVEARRVSKYQETRRKNKEARLASL